MYLRDSVRDRLHFHFYSRNHLSDKCRSFWRMKCLKSRKSNKQLSILFSFSSVNKAFFGNCISFFTFRNQCDWKSIHCTRLILQSNHLSALLKPIFYKFTLKVWPWFSQESIHYNLIRKMKPHIGGQVLHPTNLRKSSERVTHNRRLM